MMPLAGMFLCSFIANAQLPDFDLEVGIGQETCPGNGVLTFNIENTVPGSTFLFTVYHNPDLEVPISSSPNPIVDGLTAGTYTIIALQTMGAETSSKQAEVIIENHIEPLTYSLSATTHDCSTGGKIIVSTLTGIAAQYEIISGPQTRPLQESNVFPDLPAGVYNIRVFNNCGQAVVTTYTLEVNPALPEVSQPILDDVLEGDCDSVTITNTISYPEGTVISYPLDITYTINIPGGEPIVETLHFDEGAPSLLEFSNEFPIIEGEQYTYDLLVTNSCGIQYGNSGMAVNPYPEINESLTPIPCGRHYFSLLVSHYMPPFTLNFSQAPEGFSNPAAFNSAYPGPYTESPVVFGGEDMPVPDGVYIVTVTDACGRTVEKTFTVEDIVPIPNVRGRNNGCFSLFGRITASIPERKVVFAEITDAPSAYTQGLPSDVSGFINASGTLVVTNLPIGFYTLRLIDDCGEEYIDIIVEVPPFVEQDFSAITIADCTIGFGAVRVMSGNGNLTALTMTAAPEAFEEQLPFNVTASINAGVFYMDNLPVGNYTFHGTDACGIQRTASVTVTGYQPMGGVPFTFDPNCSSFDISLFDADTSSGEPGYWLQMEDPDMPGEWMHPDTGTVYPEGTLPTEENSLPLQNNHTTVNLLYFGRFRIVKAFETVGSGTSSKICSEVLGDFEYHDGVNIENIYNISCLQNTDDIYVEATGLAPLHYRIEAKDGVPFFLDNGTSSIFSGLATGSYQFVVEDACGHIGRRTENISLLPDLAVAHDPGNMLICIQPGEPAFAEFDLSEQNAGVLEGQSPNVYTVTYHTSEEDADNGLNPLPELYTNTSNPQIIYARIIHNHITICHDIISFGLQVSEYPELHMDRDIYMCTDSGPVTLTADAGFDSYEWSTGEATQSIIVETPGTYSVTVANVYGDEVCETTTDITVTGSEAATIIEVETDDWTDNHNSMNIVVSGTGQYEYSIDGINYQDSPMFTGLPTGIYFLYIRDKNGCGLTTQQFYLLNYPKFFTPNGDGVNDTWRIPFSIFEPDMEIFIFDRYGKFITSFSPESEGWDGTYNGRALPSTDYWFVVKRIDGEVHRGHFTMKR